MNRGWILIEEVRRHIGGQSENIKKDRNTTYQEWPESEGRENGHSRWMFSDAVNTGGNNYYRGEIIFLRLIKCVKN
jgi:hypothetical protein